MAMEDTASFLERLEDVDPDFYGRVRDLQVAAESGGALPERFKTLIALALDAGMGYEEGVEQLAKRARKQGATEEELLETVRMVTVTCGLQVLATASSAFASED